MSYFQAAKRWVSSLRPANRFRSLSAGMVTAMCIGLLIPALIGEFAMHYVRQKQAGIESEEYLQSKIELLASSLALPVWNYDSDLVTQIGEASLADKQVIRITVSDTRNEPLMDKVLPERRLGTSHIARRVLKLNDEVAGSVELEIDDGLIQAKAREDRLIFTLIVFCQFALALVFILFAVHHRILKPLSALTRFSNQLAGGDFERVVGGQRDDEIGHLGEQLDRMRRDLRSSFAEQKAILSNIPAGVVFVRDNIIRLANHSAENIFGYRQNRMHGLPLKDLYMSDEQYNAIQERALAYNIPTETDTGLYVSELLLKRFDSTIFWASVRCSLLDPQNASAGNIWVFEDISERKAAETEINHLAFYDPLTHLPNRRLLMDRLKHALEYSARSDKYGALLFIDLDNFKTLNDTCGHECGDLLLQEVAKRLVDGLRQTDTVARLGGDEFVVLLEDLTKEMEESAAYAQMVAEKLRLSLNDSYLIADHMRYSTPSIGITIFHDHQEKVEDLLKHADMAMYEAKSAGRNTIRFFDRKMQDMLVARTLLEDDLRQAILNEEFLLYYQPQLTRSGHISGVEALVRWKHAQRGIVSPAEFIPLAEECGLILPLGAWVLKTACQQLTQWAAYPELAGLSIAVNVSASQLHQKTFVSDVLRELKQTGANPRNLKLELTESMLVNDVDTITAQMTELKAVGVSFSLDDFGTGYSSLSYLKRLPFDQLKIDQCFVKNIFTDPNDAAIAKMVVALGISMGLNVIAEGVEYEEQREYLSGIGCDNYQGYLFSKPLPLTEFEAFFVKSNNL